MKLELSVLSTQWKQVRVEQDYSSKTKTLHTVVEKVLVSQLVGGVWFLRAEINVLLQPPHPRKSPSTAWHSRGWGRPPATPLPSKPRRTPVRDTTRQISSPPLGSWPPPRGAWSWAGRRGEGRRGGEEGRRGGGDPTPPPVLLALVLSNPASVLS